jgi:hypothetical protein
VFRGHQILSKKGDVVKTFLTAAVCLCFLAGCGERNTQPSEDQTPPPPVAKKTTERRPIECQKGQVDCPELPPNVVTPQKQFPATIPEKKQHN